jgi:hypothetical protein
MHQERRQGALTGFDDLYERQGVVKLSFQNSDVSKETVPDVKCVIAGVHNSIACMQSSVCKLTTLIHMTEANGRVGKLCQ